jgi:glycosyltransferase involved in cell wall biosynthesis
MDSKKPLKVLHVIPYYYPAFNFGGPVTLVHYLNRALVKKGIDVTVFTTNVDIEDKVKSNSEVIVDGVKVIYFKQKNYLRFLSRSGWNFSFDLVYALKNRLSQFDVVHISEVWSFSAAFASYYSVKFKKPYIVSPRGSLYPYTFKKKIWKKLPYYYFVTKRIFKKAYFIQYVTEDEKTQSHSFLRLKNKPVVVPSGIDFAEFTVLPEKDELKNKFPFLENKKVILFLSRINWIKGLDILIESFKSLARNRGDLHLLIVGEDLGDGYKEIVKGWIEEKESGIENMVTFTGLLKGKDKLMAYTGSDIFVLPSYSENFGMVVIEAMACGIPVVISDKVGLSKEIKERDVGIVVNTKAENLTEALKILLDDGELMKTFSDKGKKFAQNYNIENVAYMMIDVYKEMHEGFQDENFNNNLFL